MLTIGLTGQSGAGKGVFSEIFLKNEGTAVLDTDKVARAVTQKGQPCLDKLCRRFGNEILEEDGTLNRKKLAKIAFSDKEKHEALNKITHFHVMKRVRDWLSECEKNGVRYAVIDAPLLFESGADKLCDVTIGITAPYDVRLERVKARDGIDEENAVIRLNSQPNDEFFRENCDILLENNASEAAFESKINELFRERLSMLK